ncbi:MAG: hypothetical protein ISEC1_P0974 [Thiomicrorhabdus sp.]|nr:MAG: hypothetical protein ISEC1_P0974 [Thiomicrorhabdus sp.]
MNNSITIELNNSFRGVENRYQIELPLLFDASYLEGLPVVIPRRIAEKYGVDTYSYQFEAMEADDIYVISAEGLAAEFIKEDPVPLYSLIQWCKTVTVDDRLDYLIEKLIPDFKGNVDVKATMLQAFELGRSQS